MKNLYSLFTLLVTIIYSSFSFAQCPSGQVDIGIQITTDDWGYEILWDLTPTGNGCGNGALFTFGNVTEIDCNGAGLGVATAGGYGDNVTVTESIGCLTIGNCFDINYIDDWGDGGADFIVYQNGIPSNSFYTINTLTADTSFQFCAAEPPVNNAVISDFAYAYTKTPLSQASNIISDALITSLGSGNITGVKLDVTVQKLGSTVYTATSTPQNINTLSSSTFSVPPFSPTSLGTYLVTGTVLLDQLDDVPANNVFSYSVDITDSVYARDNGIVVDYIFVGDKGGLCNVFDITTATTVTSISQYIGNGDNGLTGLDLSMAVYSCNASGIPDTLIATTLPRIITTTTGTWYHFPFSGIVNLLPGKYAFSAEEPVNLFLSLGYVQSFSSLTNFVYVDGQIPWSAVEDFGFTSNFMIRANLNNVVGLNELENFSFEVYPNPATNDIQIPNIEIGSTVEFINGLGQILFTTKTNSTSFKQNISGFENGVYTVRISNSKQSGVARFIKQ